METKISLQNPPLSSPHQSRLKPRFPHPQPRNPHPSSILYVQTVHLPVRKTSLQSLFPLPLNSTAKFSKKHPYRNPASIIVSLSISTFPCATVTTAGLNNSLFISFPYSVSVRIHIEFASFKPLPNHDKGKPATIPRFHAPFSWIDAPFSTTSHPRLSLQSTQAAATFSALYTAKTPVV